MRGSLNDKFQKSISKCDICFEDFNRGTRTPLIICTMHHSLCRHCLDSLRVKPECPFCRERIRFDKVVINNYIFELLPVIPGEAPMPSIRDNFDRDNREDINRRPSEPVYP